MVVLDFVKISGETNWILFHTFSLYNVDFKLTVSWWRSANVYNTTSPLMLFIISSQYLSTVFLLSCLFNKINESQFFYDQNCFFKPLIIDHNSSKLFRIAPMCDWGPKSKKFIVAFFGTLCSSTYLWCGAFSSSDEKRLFRRCQDLLLCNLRDLNLLQRVFDELSAVWTSTHNCHGTIIQCWYHKPFREFLSFFWLLFWLTFALKGYVRWCALIMIHNATPSNVSDPLTSSSLFILYLFLLTPWALVAKLVNVVSPCTLPTALGQVLLIVYFIWENKKTKKKACKRFRPLGLHK